LSGTPSPEVFGKTDAGEAVHRVTLTGGGLTAKIMTWGAALQDLRLDGHDAPLTLGFPDFASYPLHSPYFGQTPGRIANRIDGGRFTLDGVAYQLQQNEGKNHLHGGRIGLGKSVWAIDDLSADTIRLSATQADGAAGYPGNCSVSCTYTLRGDGMLSIAFESTTDRPTLCNITHHSYFNLDGSPTILDHEAMIAADAYLPTRLDLIPTGALAPVEGTPYDFREMRPIRCEVDGSQVAYDNNFCLSRQRTGKRSVALVRSLHSGISLEVRTTEPGLQLYTAHKIKPTVPRLSGKTYGPFAGLCLETQAWPDAPNHRDFPSTVLRPGETLVQKTDYVFTRE
jgi:aldose 1-epimerase